MFEKIAAFLKGNSFPVIPMKWVVPVVIFFVGAIVAKMVSGLLFRLLNELEINSLFHRATKNHVNITLIISNLLKYSLYLIFLVIALNQLGITSIILYLIVGFSLLVILVTFFLGAKDFIPNFFAGMFVLKSKEIKKGDFIHCGEISGTVESTGLIETKLKTHKGEYVFVPNASLIKKSLTVKKHKKAQRK